MMRRILATALPILVLAGCADVDDTTGAPPQDPAGTEPRIVALDARAVEVVALDAVMERFLAAEDVATDVEVVRTSTDPTDAWHARVQQTYHGLPVFEGEAIVHLDRAGAFVGMTDKLVRGVAVDPVPTLDEAEAIERARAAQPRGARETAEPSTELLVFARESEPRLAYRVRLFRVEGERPSVHHHASEPVVFVDAHDGEVLFAYDDVHTFATGNSLYSGTVTFESTFFYNGKHYLETQSGGWITFDANNGGGVTHFSDLDNNWTTTDQRAGVDVHIGMNYAMSYFWEKFGRNNIDGAGGPGSATTVGGGSTQVGAYAHSGMSWENASWSSSTKRLSFGDGDPTDVAGDGRATNPWVSIDTVGHEFTHGVVYYTANLTYSGESGALNEAFADVFGTMIEFYAYGAGGNWLVGEDFWTPGVAGDALRDLANPHNSADYGYTLNDNPDHWSDRYTGSGDYGGVHINSGIAAKAFHLLAQGGSHPHGGSMAGIGREAAAWIWYVALGWYMTSGSTFKDARTATLNAAAQGYGVGSTAYNAVASSWTLVGVK